MAKRVKQQPKARPQKAKALCKSCWFNHNGKCAKKNFQYPNAKRCKEYVVSKGSETDDPEEDKDKSYTPPPPAILLRAPKKEEEPKTEEPTEAELRRLKQFQSYFEN